MKKRVRIYKSPNGKGEYLNKTAQFLRKAQMGGTPDVEDLSYPGAGQQQAQPQMTEDQLHSMILNDISNSRPREEIVVKLVNVFGQDPLEATNMVNQMYTYVEQQSEAEKDADDEEEDDEEVKTGDPANAEEEAVIAAEDDQDQDGFYGDDSNNDIANETADEDDEADDDDSDVASQIVARRGGFVRAEEGMEIQDTYSVQAQNPIVFPGVEAYLPANMADMISGGYDPATGQAWQRPQFEAPETSDDSGLSAESMASEQEQPSEALSFEAMQEQQFMKGGAYKKNKRAYVNSVLKLVKKQMGGDSEEGPSIEAEKADQADPIGNSFRRSILDNYIGTLKNQGQLALAKEQAEEAYDNMMRQQAAQSMYGQEPMIDYPTEDGSLDEAQFGGFFRRRRMNDMNVDQRGMFGRQPRIPRGFNYGYPPIESIDVRRSGWLGRPKEYTVNFGRMPSVMPGYGMPGYGPGFYGYGYKTTKKTPGRKIVEDQAVYVNSQSNKDVAAVTPGNEATNKEGKVEEKKTETVTTATTPGGTTTTDATTTTTPSGTTTTTTTEKKEPTVQNSSTTAKEKQVKKEVVQQKKTANVVKPKGATPEAPKAPVSFAPQYRPDLVRDNTRVVSRVPAVNIPKVNLTKTKPTSNNIMNMLNSQKINPLAYAQALKINDPAQRQAAINKIMFPFGFKEEGGIVDNPFTDEYGTLQRFVYGGNEDPSLAYIDQSDIDYTNSTDTTDPYFQDGGSSIRAENPTDEINPKTGKKWTWDEWHSPGGKGYEDMQKRETEWKTREDALKKREEELNRINQSQQRNQINYPGGYPGYQIQSGRRPGVFNTLFPANISPSYYTKYMGARNAQGQMINPMIGPNSYIKSVDVHKTGWLTGRPKKYSITFGHESSDPTKQNIITLNEPGKDSKGSSSTPGKKGENQLSQKEIARGDRQAGRQRPWYLGKKWENDFEEYEYTPEEQKRIDENEARHKANRETERKQKADAEALINKVFNPSAQTPGMNANQTEQFQQMITNPSGIPSYSDGIQSLPGGNRSGAPASPVIATGSYVAPGTSSPGTYDYSNKSEAEIRADYMSGKIPQSEASRDGITIIKSSGEPITDEDFERYKKENAEGYAYGGALRNFLHRAQLGGTNPVVYTNNPAMDGISEVDLVSLNPGIQGLQGGMDWSMMSSPGENMPTRDTSNDPKQYTVDPNQAQRHQIDQTYEPEGDVTLDFKEKQQWDNASVQGALLTGNALLKSGVGFLDRMKNKKREKEMYKNLTSDNLYASDPSRDRGDWETNSGLKGDMGSTWNSRSKQFGGENAYLNEDPDYVEGDEVYMTDEEIAQYLANGGQIEYL